ncbi:response regulator [Marinospirillum perlucidum]|uniref:response regulator n=1 Tax=Marinospirillum perlucidum TaxID=1982602 RepID=UPI00139002AD|nr:response regulator [Marinospirillum perlucidum]
MKKIRLLTVDDDKFIRNLVQKTLKTEYSNFDVQEADHGRRAQALMQKHSYDLVLCDWEMPEMNGLELLQWVRSEEEHKDQPFILVTSLDSKDNVIQAVEAGVDDYIAKPFTPEQLLGKVVKTLVKKGHLTQEEAAAMKHRERIAAAGGAELLAGGRSLPKTKKVAKGPKSKGLLVAGEARAPVTVKDVNRREARLLAKRSEIQPALGSLVHVGLMGGPDEQPLKVSLRAFVSGLKLGELNPRTDQLQIRVVFLKQEGEVAEQFERLLNSPT